MFQIHFSYVVVELLVMPSQTKILEVLPQAFCFTPTDLSYVETCFDISSDYDLFSLGNKSVIIEHHLTYIVKLN